jgi:hypothetical protein
MSWFVRKAAPPLTEAALVQQTLTELAPQVEAFTQHLPQALMQQTVIPLLYRLIGFCWNLPASEAHHHSRPFGLLTHSLEVATHALEAFTQSSLWWAKAPDPAQRHRMADRWRLGTALAGLLHDLGKVFDVTVTLPPANGSLPARWDPFQEPLLSFLLQHPTSTTLPTPTVQWQPGRGMQHEAAGALAAALLLTRDDLQALTLPVARELYAFVGGAPDPANLFRQLICQPQHIPHGAADRQSVRADRQAIPPAQPALAARVLATLSQCCRQGPLRVNQFPGHVFVLAEETLVVVPEGLKPVRTRLALEGLTLPGGGVLYNDLAEAGYLLGPAGRNVTKARFQLQGKRPVLLAVLRLPHALLWGAHPPAPFAGQVDLDLPEETVADEPTPLALTPATEKE